MFNRAIADGLVDRAASQYTGGGAADSLGPTHRDDVDRLLTAVAELAS